MLGNAFFQLGEEMPSPALSSPQALRFVFGYGIHNFSRERTGGNVPRNVFITDPYRVNTLFTFADGSSVANPMMGPEHTKKACLMMVDAEGWACTNDPAYYDLYPGNGDRYRFVAATNSEDFAQLVLYRSAAGREETPQDIGLEVIKDENDVLRQVLAPSRLADIVVQNSFKYSINFYRRSDVQAEKDTDGYYVPVSNASPIIVWTIENPETNTINKLRVTKMVGNATNVSDFTYTAASEEWKLVQGAGLVENIRGSEWDDARQNRIETILIRAAQGDVASKRANRYHTFPWSEAVVAEVHDPDGAALTKEYAYYENSSDIGRYTKTRTEHILTAPGSATTIRPTGTRAWRSRRGRTRRLIRRPPAPGRSTMTTRLLSPAIRSSSMTNVPAP